MDHVAIMMKKLPLKLEFVALATTIAISSFFVYYYMLRRRKCGTTSAVDHEETAGASSSQPTVEIDEDLHSRQLAVYGRETMRRLSTSNVLVSGLHGLGLETAKNLILAGVGSVTLHDTKPVEVSNLGAQFYFTLADVGKNRALACLDKLRNLNTSVMVSANTQEISENLLSRFEVVVFTDVKLGNALKYNKFCHDHYPPIAFIKANVCGVFGSVFCDFGPAFTTNDIDGEEPNKGVIAFISNGNPSIVSCVDDERLDFQDGDLVVFEEVQGMNELNDKKARRIRECGPHSFTLEEDTTHFAAYSKGGIVIQVKQSKVLKFKPLEDALQSPGAFLCTDYSKTNRCPLLHLAFQALDEFHASYGRYAAEDDASTFIDLVKEKTKLSQHLNIETVDEAVLRHFASGSGIVLNPMAAMFGGIVGQEVIKACSGKFHPLFQFLYFDSLESLAAEALKANNVTTLGTRYDAQTIVFGHKYQQKLQETKVLVVGAGALGCELLKNFAMMGVACGTSGRLIVTDDDVIEKSNLSRQFLFSNKDIGKAKSTVAASAVMAMNPSLQVEALQNRIGPETEVVFDDAFWAGIDVVITALDNVEARLYVDSKCVYFQKPLLDSGTLGTKCSTQVVIPHLTENYGATRDPPEKQVPMCTLHYFPYKIDHCLTWARSEFDEMLMKTPSEAKAFLSNPEQYINSITKSSRDVHAAESLKRLIECLITDICNTFEDCVEWARKRFEHYFVNHVKHLTFAFPEDAVSSKGALFWSAPKRFPKPLQFSSNDPSHISFITAASVLRAKSYGIPIPGWAMDPHKLTNVVDRTQLPLFVPNLEFNSNIGNEDGDHDSSQTENSESINRMIQTLKEGIHSLPPRFQMQPVQFEKDNDSNFHMDFIAGLANMRARNYGIKEVDRLTAKIIAGRIVPAIATSTAVAAGLVCLELYKVLHGEGGIERYRNSFVNLALPLMTMAEPSPAAVGEHGGLKWSVWDRWEVHGDLKLGELLDWFKREKGLVLCSISCGRSLLYQNAATSSERLEKRMVELAQEIAKLQIPPQRHHVDIEIASEEYDGPLPTVSVHFRQ